MVEKNPKIEYVVVLSSTAQDKNGVFPDFEQDKKDLTKEIYVGGGARMQAGLKLAALYPNATFIMVGGSYEQDGKVVHKADEMAKFIKKEFPNLNLMTINSESSTFGNLTALVASLKDKLHVGNFIVLSNDYHIERIAEFWKKIKEDLYSDLPDIEFITVSQMDIEERVPVNSEGYVLRLQREKEGIKASQDGNYKTREIKLK